MNTNSARETENLRADITVIGGGGSGLTAAVAAAEAGVKDISVLEKTASLGGNTALAHGIFAVESPAQRRLGIRATRDEVFRRQMENSHWMVDPRLVRAYVDKSGEIIRWLEDKGLNFTCVVDEFLPGGDSFFHMVGKGFEGACGPKIAEVLVRECRSLGIKVLCETAASEILLDGEGRVKGVLAIAGDKEISISSKSAIIATGGFGGNQEMLKKHFPMFAGKSGNSLPQMTGDGLLIAEKAGAFIDDYYSILLIGPSYDEKAAFSLGVLLMQPEMLLVNKNGERYCDEALFLNFHNWSGNSLNRQPGNVCFGLLDSGIKHHVLKNKGNYSGFFRSLGGDGAWATDLENDLQKESDAGNIKAAASLEEIAGFMEVDSAALMSTVERYNSFCDDAYDADFLKEKRYLLPLRTPPYYAVPGHQNFDTTLGGIRINHHAEVIDRNTKPIPGLYAAGDNAGSWLSQNYDLQHPGSALGFAISSGHIAGESATRYLRQLDK